MKKQSKFGPLKRGHVRADGMVFWCYKLGREVWCSSESFAGRKRYGREWDRKYIAANRDKMRKKNKVYREKNKEKEYERRKAFAERNREAVNRWARAYVERNKAAVYARSADYHRRNRAKINERKNAYRKERSRSDVIFAIKQRMRSRLGAALRKIEAEKPCSTIDIVGCYWTELKSHIESKFSDGMGWHNREAWHIDHIIPLATANSVDDIVRLSHYTNLQPLWASENIRKGAAIL